MGICSSNSPSKKVEEFELSWRFSLLRIYFQLLRILLNWNYSGLIFPFGLCLTFLLPVLINGIFFFFYHRVPEKFSCFFQACDLTCNGHDPAYSFSVSWNWEVKDTTVLVRKIKTNDIFLSGVLPFSWAEFNMSWMIKFAWGYVFFGNWSAYWKKLCEMSSSLWKNKWKGEKRKSKGMILKVSFSFL